MIESLRVLTTIRLDVKPSIAEMVDTTRENNGQLRETSCTCFLNAVGELEIARGSTEYARGKANVN